LCPFTNSLTSDELLDLLADCAERVERLRKRGVEIVFLTGSELSLFTVGFLPGDRLEDRLTLMAEPRRVRPLIPSIRTRLNEFLGKAVEATRARFGGKLSYASIPFEGVDWRRFDIISTDAGYRTAEIAARFCDAIRGFVSQGRAHGKPLAITEFGCATYRGAANRADRLDIIEWDDARPFRLKGEHTRDEDEQARYISELLDVFESEGVDNVFVYTFARYGLPHRDAPREDFDVASYGVVKVLQGRRGQRYPDMPWEPKSRSLSWRAATAVRLLKRSGSPSERLVTPPHYVRL
jgi:hypothetical protein